MTSMSLPTSPTLLDRFSAMVRMRHFEEACLEGVPTREIHGELHLAIGQEAIAAGLIGPLDDRDALVSTHRNHLHALAKGVPAEPLLAEIYERADGLCGGFGGHMHPFDPARNFSASGIVGASLPVAAGHAYAARLDGTDAVAVAVTGDAGTNTGAFHETLVMAGAWKLPLVVLVENNGYGISVPIDRVTAPGGIAARSSAYGCRVAAVDGTDTEQVAAAFREAVEHARAGHGPALVEATCARFRGHFEGDTDHYRRSEERARDLADRDPLVRCRAQLTIEDPSCEEALDAMIDESKRATDLLLQRVRAMVHPDPATAHRHVFSEAS
jgi:TPP-dependent pyruvate/acetoin dehydrogenase alpha subunit